MSNLRLALTASAVLLLLSDGLLAADRYPVPAPPKQYDVLIRYRIQAPRVARIPRFAEMIQYLETAGLQRDPGPPGENEDPDATLLTGTVDSENAALLARAPFVQTVRLLPAGYKLPEEEGARVKIDIRLTPGLPPDRQRLLSDQALAKLRVIGFVDQVGFDHKGFTRLRGTLPVEALDVVMRDLRSEPGGWFAPDVPYALLPLPIRQVSPLKIVEVVPEPEGSPPALPAPAAAPSPPADQPYLRKLSPELLGAVGNLPAETPLRVEIILTRTPEELDRVWRRKLSDAASDWVIEGRLGPVLTGSVPFGQVPALAALAEVSAIRLPRLAVLPQLPAPKPLDGVAFDPLVATRLDRLHKNGLRGTGIRVVIIDADFAGAERFIGRQLPASTTLIDLTAMRSPTLTPDPSLAEVGHGTQVALAAAYAAPNATFVLVRIDPAAPYMVHTVARYVAGEAVVPDDLLNRRSDMVRQDEDLRFRRQALLARRQEAFDDFSQEDEAVQRRQQVVADLAALGREEEALRARAAYLLRITETLIGLRGAEVVVVPMVWDTGWPQDGDSPLARALEETFTPLQPCRRMGGLKVKSRPLWFAPAGNSRGQAWTGLLRDADENGVLEFVPPDWPLAPVRWTRELNFLGMDPLTESVAATLPGQARLRITVQWQETHDPSLYDDPEDVYREPLTVVRMVLLRQRDPDGRQLPADDLDVVAVSSGLPVRVAHEPSQSRYEQTLEVSLPAEGRYALRMEGKIPDHIRPATVPTLPVQRVGSEVRARVFVEVLDAPSQALGRPVFLDYPPVHGGVGVPSDSRAVLSVGAVDRKGQPREFSQTGGGPGVLLAVKPDLYAYDELPLALKDRPARGTSIASGFAAGSAATLLSNGASQDFFLKALGVTRGGLFMVPEFWVEAFEQRKRGGTGLTERWRP